MSTVTKPAPAPVAPTIAPTPTWMALIGWIFSLLPGVAFLYFGYMKLSGNIKPPPGAPDTGWGEEATVTLAMIEIAGAIFYLFPSTAMLGAVVLTGYLGGAIATHVRIGDWFAIPFAFAVLIWLGLLFRDARLRAMLPFRRSASEPAGPSGCLYAIGVVLLTVVIVAGLIAGISQAFPTDYRVARSRTMNAAPDKVFPHVADFNKWKPWNPFTEADPDIKLTIEGKPGEIGSIYKWEGNNQVGKGQMTMKDVVPNERINLYLEFEEPFKGEAESEFRFKLENGQTKVTWSMNGKSDPVHKMVRGVMPMEMMIGSSYEKGLKKLEDIVRPSDAPKPEQ
jgi:uncharacterized protein YndB with AHSA1/START domain